MIFTTKHQIDASISEEEKKELKTMTREELYNKLLYCAYHGYLSKLAYITVNYVEELNNYSREYIQISFSKACHSSNIEVIRFLLTSDLIEHKADIHYDKDAALKWACENDNIELVKYLVESSELKEHANPYIDDCEPFQIAANSGYMDIVDYFILNYELDYNEAIKNHLEMDNPINKESIIKKFESRELSKKLEYSLQNNSHSQQINKI